MSEVLLEDEILEKIESLGLPLPLQYLPHSIAQWEHTHMCNKSLLSKLKEKWISFVVMITLHNITVNIFWWVWKIICGCVQGSLLTAISSPRYKTGVSCVQGNPFITCTISIFLYGIKEYPFYNLNILIFLCDIKSFFLTVQDIKWIVSFAKILYGENSSTISSLWKMLELSPWIKFNMVRFKENDMRKIPFCLLYSSSLPDLEGWDRVRGVGKRSESTIVVPFGLIFSLKGSGQIGRGRKETEMVSGQECYEINRHSIQFFNLVIT